MKKLFVWSGDNVPGIGVAIAFAERLEDAVEEITIGITGCSKPADALGWDIDFLLDNPSVYMSVDVEVA